jgi:histone-lysine N-methyltransferase SETD8
MRGLLGQSRAPRLEVIHAGPLKGRGVVSSEPIKKGSYVCEYRTYKIYHVGSEEAKALAQEYELNGEGSYVLETAHPVPGVGRLCFDVTRRYKDVGRLINHSATGYNIKPGAPLHIRGKWRVGMVAVKDVNEGQELTYDYGVRSEGWMKAKGVGDVGETRGEDGGREDDDAQTVEASEKPPRF